jgi:hypothetical protein
MLETGFACVCAYYINMLETRFACGCAYYMNMLDTIYMFTIMLHRHSKHNRNGTEKNAQLSLKHLSTIEMVLKRMHNYP